jgi:hypothetical protein
MHEHSVQTPYFGPTREIMLKQRAERYPQKEQRPAEETKKLLIIFGA